MRSRKISNRKMIQIFNAKQKVVYLEKKIKKLWDDFGCETFYLDVQKKEESVNYYIQPDGILNFYSYVILLWKDDKDKKYLYNACLIINQREISCKLFEKIYRFQFPNEQILNCKIKVAVSYQQNYLMKVVKNDKEINDKMLMQEVIDCLAVKYDLIKTKRMLQEES